MTRILSAMFFWEMTSNCYPASQPHFAAQVRNGFLWVDLPRGRQIVCSGWPVMKAWTRLGAKEGWQRYRPELDIVTGLVGRRFLILGGNPIGLLRKTQAGQAVEPSRYDWQGLINDFAPVRHYFSNVPAQESRLVSTYFDRQWQMLELAARCGSSALNLMASNPALAYCVASYSSFVPGRPPVDFDHLTRVLQMRRRDICGVLGFPANESTVKILGKVPPEHCAVSRLLSLRERLRCSRVRRTLAHLPVVNKAVLGALQSKAHESVTPSFLAKCAAYNEAELESLLPGTLLNDAARVYSRWKKRSLPKRIFRNMKQLQQFIQKAERRYDDEEFHRIMNLRFPAAPFRGTETIQPIDTPRLLLEEAEEQHNCVRMYADEIAEGSRYLYRLTSPKRATIAFIRSDTGWKISEIAGPLNRFVSDETRRVVEEWLAEQR